MVRGDGFRRDGQPPGRAGRGRAPATLLAALLLAALSAACPEAPAQEPPPSEVRLEAVTAARHTEARLAARAQARVLTVDPRGTEAVLEDAALTVPRAGLTLRAPRLVLDTRTLVASGDRGVRIEGEHFEIRGQRFVAKLGEETVHIDGPVHGQAVLATPTGTGAESEAP